MNIFDLLKNAGQLKEQAKKIQDEMQNIVCEGSSGGKMVTVKMNGTFEIVDIHLDPICVDNRDVKMLEDLIVAASRDARSKVQEEIKKHSNSVLSSIDMSSMGL